MIGYANEIGGVEFWVGVRYPISCLAYFKMEKKLVAKKGKQWIFVIKKMREKQINYHPSATLRYSKENQGERRSGAEKIAGSGGGGGNFSWIYQISAYSFHSLILKAKDHICFSITAGF